MRKKSYLELTQDIYTSLSKVRYVVSFISSVEKNDLIQFNLAWWKPWILLCGLPKQIKLIITN